MLKEVRQLFSKSRCMGMSPVGLVPHHSVEDDDDLAGTGGKANKFGLAAASGVTAHLGASDWTCKDFIAARS
jgi:hypothetical protein